MFSFLIEKTRVRRQKQSISTYSTILLIAGSLLAPLMSLATADTVWLENETVSGSFFKIKDHTLFFRTALKGQMVAPMDTIRGISTERPLLITLEDGRILHGVLQYDSESTHLVPTGDKTKALPIRLTDIKEAILLPTAAPTEAGDLAAIQGTSTKVEGGAGIMQHLGSDKTTLPYTELQISNESRGVSSRVALGSTAGSDAPEFARGEASLVLQPDDTISPWLQGDVWRDIPSATEWRTGLTLGLRYNPSPEDKQGTAWFLGLRASAEKRETDIAEAPAWGIAAKETSASKDALSLHLGLHYSRLLTENASLEGTIQWQPGLTDVDYWRLYAEANLRVPLYNRLQLRLNVWVSYDADTLLPDVPHWQSSISAGLTYDF